MKLTLLALHTSRFLSTEASVFIGVDPWLTIFRFHITAVFNWRKSCRSKGPGNFFVFYLNAARNPYGVTVR